MRPVSSFPSASQGKGPNIYNHVLVLRALPLACYGRPAPAPRPQYSTVYCTRCCTVGAHHILKGYGPIPTAPRRALFVLRATGILLDYVLRVGHTHTPGTSYITYTYGIHATFTSGMGALARRQGAGRATQHGRGATRHARYLALH
jgi:hypothetical protein